MILPETKYDIWFHAFDMNAPGDVNFSVIHKIRVCEYEYLECTRK